MSRSNILVLIFCVQRRGPKSSEFVENLIIHFGSHLDRFYRYVRLLEIRIEKLEGMLRKVFNFVSLGTGVLLRQAKFQPDINLDWDLEDLVAEDKQSPTRTASESKEPSLPTPASRSSSDDENDLAHIAISEHMSNMMINETDESKYIGSASNLLLVQHAMDVKGHVGAINNGSYERRQYWEHHAVSIHTSLTFAALTY